MSNRTIGLSDQLSAYVRDVGVREPDVLARLREETAALPQHGMQIAPEQGALLAMLVELTGARRCVEVGTFTGYPSTAVALALPDDGRIVCCDVSEEWTAMARRCWEAAGVAHKVDLRIAPATETLDALLDDGEESSYDFAFVDADKTGYDGYYEACLTLLRPGGLIAFDNMLWSGAVADPKQNDPDTVALRALNQKVRDDSRVTSCLVSIGDGVLLARKH